MNKPHPVSWLIDEVQDTVDRIGLADAPATVRSPISSDGEGARSPGERDLSDAPHLVQRRQTLRPAWSLPSIPAPSGAEPRTTVASEPPPVSSRGFTTPEAPLREPDPLGSKHDVQPLGGGRALFFSGRSEELTPPEPVFAPAPPAAVVASSSAPPASFRLGRVLLTAIVALPLGLIAGMIGARIPGNSRPGSTRAVPGLPPAVAPAPSSLSELRERSLRPETINAILARLTRLADRSEALYTRMEQLVGRKPEPAAELAELRVEFGRLSATAGELAPMPADLRRIDERVKNVSATLQNLHDEVAALRTKVERPASSPLPARDVSRAVMPGGAEEGTTTLSDDTWTELQGGVKLFKKGRFKEALGVFNGLEVTNPNDARVWYYAALSSGFATNQWTGGTQQLVEKGIERERAGTPSTRTIDAAFNDLPATLGRDWLAEYRRRATIKPDTAPSAMPSVNAQNRADQG